MNGPLNEAAWRGVPWLSLPEVARASGLSQAHVYRLADAGDLPVETCTEGPRRSQRVVRPDDLDRWLRDRQGARQDALPGFANAPATPVVPVPARDAPQVQHQDPEVAVCGAAAVRAALHSRRGGAR